jgi:BlaI family transcriptional regulator, penicillinase repressor
MAQTAGDGLSRRERQILDILYRRGRASVTEVIEDMPDPPSDSAVRALLRILEQKQHVTREEVGNRRYVFRPARPRESAGRTALRRVLRTFFDDSAEKAVLTLLDVSNTKLSQQDLDRLVRLIEQARKKGQ